MIGRSSLGEYHLQIENATFDDEAQYECHIEETSTSASQTSAAASLKIICLFFNRFCLKSNSV